MGEVVGHVKGSEKRDYVTDPLGSVVAYLNDSQVLTDQFEYWPYGELAGEIEAGVGPFLWVGSLGYFRDSDLTTYIRARTYRQDLGSWTQLDPLWPNTAPMRYCRGLPTYLTDKFGLSDSGCASFSIPLPPIPIGPILLPITLEVSRCCTDFYCCDGNAFCGEIGIALVSSVNATGFSLAELLGLLRDASGAAKLVSYILGMVNANIDGLANNSSGCGTEERQRCPVPSYAFSGDVCFFVCGGGMGGRICLFGGPSGHSCLVPAVGLQVEGRLKWCR